MKFTDPYQNPQLYDAQYWWKKNDLELWKFLAHSYKVKNILEIGSGTGRVGIPLLLDGFIYSGVELSIIFNNYLIKKINTLGMQAKIYNGNFESFNLNGKFDFILSVFNTFNHCLSKKSFAKMLINISKHLDIKGRFVFELFVPDPLALYRSQSLKLDLMEYTCPSTYKSIQIKESISYNHINHIINVRWYYYQSNTLINKIKFNMKAWHPETVINMIDNSPFIIEKIIGDYDGGDFNSQSKKQIFICKNDF